MSKSYCYTFTFATTKPIQTFVFIKWLDDVDAAITYANGAISTRKDIKFILIREGDARPTDPVIWDSRKVISLRNLAPVLGEAMPLDIRGTVAGKADAAVGQLFVDLAGPNTESVNAAISVMAQTKARENNITLPVYEWVVPEPFKVKQKPNLSERQSYNCRITPTDCISCYVSDSEPKLGDLFAIVATNESSQKVSALLTLEDAYRLREQLNAYLASQV